MNQHISSMLEHLSSLRRKNSESAHTSSNDKQIVVVPSTDSVDHKDVNDVETVGSKTKSIFKDLISDNSATNILQNLNFIKCSTISSHLANSHSANGTCKEQQVKVNNHDDDDNNNRQATQNTLQPTANESNNVHHRKRNSVVRANANGNGLERELSPSPRPHRKSSHDIRMFRSNHLQDENQDVGKSSGVIVKPLKSKNIITKNETFDTLHGRAMDVSSEKFFFFFVMS
jgi:hypothetical protein